MKKLEKITIVGGGTAGFVCALILKTRFPNKEISVICSKKIGIIGVGEGSTEHWHDFMKYIGISFQQVIQECDATFKSGIMFKGWTENDYLHSVSRES
jgi:thioredoxin reductase